ncbi:MAG TPA: SDR family NAD(P)-dependent oxidoreductase [Bauldia sp.]|nr:SDR family NAD(P)-dependent oxidoreductase [Bauldia sp.]
MRFTDKVAIVTGGSLGIGEAAARAFAAQGGRVVIASRDPSRGQDAVERIEEAGGIAVHVATDVADERGVERLMETTLSRFGRLDILVNNAAVYVQGDVAATSATDWDRVIAVNLTGAFLGTKHAVDALAATRGVVINVSSEAGLVGIAGQVAYNVSKAGMIALTKSCAVDLAPRGIRVNCVCPGTTATPLVDAAVARASDPAAARRRLETIRPLGRLGTSEEIASAILYLASPEAAYATGAVLSIDGGYTAQ